MGAQAYRLLALYDPAPGVLVEIGSERGEGSTAYLASYAARHDLEFATADIDPETSRQALEITLGAWHGTGASLLRKLKAPISIAYMDGFDWIPDGQGCERWIEEQRERYAELGVDMNNDACQREHLKEARLIAKKAAERCVVICDDTFRESDGWSGKGGLAVPHFERQSFTVVDSVGPAETSLGYVVLQRG